MPIGAQLMARGVLTQAKLDLALADQRTSGDRLDRVLLRLGLVTKRQLLEALGEQFHLPVIDLASTPVEPEVLGAIPAKLVFRQRCVPIARSNGSLLVATSDPFELAALDELRLITNARIELVLADDDDLQRFIRTHYGVGTDTLDALSAGLEAKPAARASVVGALERACAMDASGNPAAALASSFPELSRLLGGRVRWARLWITPFFSLTVEGSAMDRVLVRQTFDFAASHRLHNPALSPEDNARLYGKCNNPRGHGHNYRVEPAFACPIDAAHAVDLAAIERVVDEVVIRRFDHKNLNEDTEEFATGRGANPSVENIARVVYELLGPEAPKIGRGVGLVGVTVWETDRTSATYPA